MLDKLDERAKCLEEIAMKAREQGKIDDQTIETLRQTSREKSQMAIDFREKLDQHKKALAAMTKSLEDATRECSVSAKKIRSLKESCLSWKKKCEKLGKGPPSDVALEAEIRAVKARLQCSVCSERDKSVVITKCFHAFCNECIQQNLKVRLRKCPGCGISFGQDDVHPIYLT